MAKIKYIRVSTTHQNTDRQEQNTQDFDKVFIDKISGKNTNRPEFQKMMDYVREGDVVVFESFSRISRSLPDLLNILDTFDKKTKQKQSKPPTHCMNYFFSNPLPSPQSGDAIRRSSEKTFTPAPTAERPLPCAPAETAPPVLSLSAPSRARRQAPRQRVRQAMLPAI